MPQAKKDIDRPGSQRRRNGKFRGMVLERLGGRTLDVELAARRSGLQDVHFIREVLFQVWRLRYTGLSSGCPGFAVLGMSGLPEGSAVVKELSSQDGHTLFVGYQAGEMQSWRYTSMWESSLAQPKLALTPPPADLSHAPYEADRKAQSCCCQSVC